MRDDIDIPVPPVPFEPTLDDIMYAIMDAASEEGWVFDSVLGAHSLDITNVRWVSDGVRMFESFGRRWRLALEEVS